MAARVAAGVSRAEIADAAGVTRQAVHAWETGRQVPFGRNALAYARALSATAPRAAAELNKVNKKGGECVRGMPA